MWLRVTRKLLVLHMVDSVLQLVDRATRVEVLGASLGAVHDSMATVELVGIIQALQTLLRHLITGIGNPAVSLLENGRTEVLIRVPPVGRARGGAAGAENALVETVQQQTILVGLEILNLVVGVHLALLLEPGLDGSVLLVEVGHISDQILNHVHMGKRTHRGDLGILGNFGEAGQTVLAVDVHSTRTANSLTAGSSCQLYNQ